jgi:exodeoxyribonuclease V gamma subunit
VLEGAELQTALLAERARGLLPPDPLSESVLDVVVPAVENLSEQVTSMPWFGSQARSLEINLRLECGRTLVGTVAGVRDSTLVACGYSKLAPKHRLEAWVRWLALAASGAVKDPAAVTVGRSGSRNAASVAVSNLRFGEGAEDPTSSAATMLNRLIDLYDRGMREPLPLYCKTSFEWATKSRSGDGSERHAKKAWDGELFDGESAEEAHTLVLGGRLPFHALFGSLPRFDESGPGWAESEQSRFGRLARRLWDDLLDHETPAGLT